MSTQIESLWRGLIEVCPEDGTSLPENMAGAFVVVAGRATSRQHFVALVTEECRNQRLQLLDMEDVLGDATENDLEDCMVGDIRSHAGGIVMGTFHLYPADA